MSNFSDRLGNLRKKSGDTLQQAGDAVGVSKPHFHEMEKGKSINPRMNTIKAIAHRYRVTTDYLILGGTSTKHSIVHDFEALKEKDQGTILFMIKHFNEASKRNDL
jgi:transcriptional regulator with XRE-family HTH domain